MKRHLRTLLLLAAAVALYAVGLALPAGLLVVLGAIAEVAFWFRLFGRRRPDNDNSTRRTQ